MSMTPLFSDDRNLSDFEFPLNKIKPRTIKTRIYSEEARASLKAMISAMGILDSLVIDEDNNLLHGQLRYEIAKELGLKTAPVIITTTAARLTGDTNVYHMLADRIVEWDKWRHSDIQDILRPLAGKDCGGTPWEELFSSIGWFIAPEDKPSATLETIEKISKVYTRWLPSRFNFHDAQLLYIETLRQAIQDLRESMIANNDIDGGVVEKYKRHMQEEKDNYEAGGAMEPQEDTLKRLKKKYKINKKPKLGETAKNQLKPTAKKVIKGAAGKKPMSEYQFTFFGQTYGGLTAEESREFYRNNSPAKLNKYIQKHLEEDPTIPANTSKKAQNS